MVVTRLSGIISRSTRLFQACLPALLLGTAGCWVVRPPAVVNDPVPIFLADYGVHSSVLIPAAPGMYVEYSFGDYAYVVEDREMPWNAVAALLFSFQSTVGRNFTPLESYQPAPVTSRLPDRVYRINVERDKVAGIVKQLDDRFRAGGGPPEYVRDTGGYYVRDSHHYSVINSCNQLTTTILRASGCSVYGVPLISNFIVMKP